MIVYVYKWTFMNNKLECMYAIDLRSITHFAYNNISLFSHCCFMRKLTKSQESKLEKYLKKEDEKIFRI